MEFHLEIESFDNIIWPPVRLIHIICTRFARILCLNYARLRRALATAIKQIEGISCSSLWRQTSISRIFHGNLSFRSGSWTARMEFARREAKRNEVMARPRILNTRQSFLIPPEKLPYRNLFSHSFAVRPASAKLGRSRKNFIRNNESTATRRTKASANIINPDGNFICTVGTPSLLPLRFSLVFSQI